MDHSLLLQVTQMGVGAFIVRSVVVAAVAYFATRVMSGIYVKDFSAAILLALVLALLNATVGWLLSILATPLDFVTFGIFSGLIALVINALVIKIADGLLGDFKVKSFWWALGLALVLSLVTGLFNVGYGVNV